MLDDQGSFSKHEEYLELLSCIPKKTIEYAFAYGSGALKQKNEKTADKMVDFVLCTNDPVQFHKENIETNPSHYSLLKMAGPKFIANFQTKSAARVYYNTHVNVGKRVIKYGIIGADDLRSDLLDWKWLYIAGRLHKPVLEVIRPHHLIDEGVKENRKSALQVALLLLPDEFKLHELYKQIVALSYIGDFRMTFGEDKNKVSKIVDGSFDELHAVYKPFLEEDSRLVMLPGNKLLQDASSSAIYHRFNLLPSTVLDRLQSGWNKRVARQRDMEEVLFSMSHRHDINQHLLNAISSIVASTALKQTAKNAASAGLTRSIVYSLAKMNKMIRSLKG